MFCFVKRSKVIVYLALKLHKRIARLSAGIDHMFSHTINFARCRGNSIEALRAALRATFYSAATLLICLTASYGAGNAVSSTGNNRVGIFPESAFSLAPRGPANVCGRVKVRKGRAIAAATLTATSGRGDLIVTRTATFGYYCFIGLSAGETYIITVSARGYYFPEPNEVIIPFEDVYGLDFEAL
jgi:hypothetical protein